MRYRFNEFEFDSVSLLLTRHDEAQAIRHTEAKVLAVLLEQLDTVLNKEDILSHVWQDKIVSEQVVFQNISNLRSLFGNDSIKTFPKRGYQWQLTTEVVLNETENLSSNLNLQNSPHSQKLVGSVLQPASSISTKKRLFWQLAMLVCIICITVVAIYFQNEVVQKKPEAIIKLAYIPMTNRDGKAISKDESIMLEDNADFDFTALKGLDTELFEDNSEVEYSKLSNIHPFILTGYIRTYKKYIYLDFMLKGPYLEWEGLISGLSKQDVIKQLLQHLKQDVIYDLINKPQSPELQQAKLSIIHQASPNDLNILQQLSIVYLKTDELEKAMIMADKLFSLAQFQNKPQHMGRALLYQSKILTRKKLYDLSSQKLKLAMVQFEKINDLKHLAHAWYYQSWLDHQHKNYPAIKTSLLTSAQLAYGANNKLGEIEALIYLAVLAHNYQNDGDRDLYLQQAEKKMNAYQLPKYHFALISYRYATFAKALSEKEPHLKQVLKLTALTPEHWAAESSRRQLMQYYITQNRLVEAQALIDSVTSDNSNNSYLKTLMAQAKQQTKKMISFALRTFEQAQLAGNRSLSLDVALLLCSLQINCDFYSQFIDDNATAKWRSDNEIKLRTLNP
ncbi:winged helix-turn-helix domain-containing protein [Pseudoalteromonas denitrificans]|uniref:DNA-binding winged helix-turn-helix (WHTH) domain-containing protein n=1 Tax=Pseudoalteromonas denitrificans DSM 6059 TaxID=1123010 RepID=A0A1I1JSD5_9GAMM|nr:winged helix-turn-helix domain-containing protein [Pseudoalteromonas denitrificans]SFC48270.1 DNA-binding winged helix-turn-helix (wHTH) domain-containing protein [Pseudoalteromonas denitrificans DSM 6059]